MQRHGELRRGAAGRLGQQVRWQRGEQAGGKAQGHKARRRVWTEGVPSARTPTSQRPRLTSHPMLKACPEGASIAVRPQCGPHLRTTKHSEVQPGSSSEERLR